MKESGPVLCGEIAVFQAADGAVQVEAHLERRTVLLTQAQIAALFGRERSVIAKHVRNHFHEGAPEAGAVCAIYAQTGAGGKTDRVDAYNLDVIISVGYRVSSQRGTQVGRWGRFALPVLRSRRSGNSPGFA
jgi:hypothetical protein